MKTSTTEHFPSEKNTCSASLVRSIAAIEAEIQTLENQLQKLKHKKREADSRDFIVANRIILDDVEMSSGDTKPWFGTVWEFGKWLAGNSEKVWLEWNGRIYRVTDIANGRMPDMPGEVDHLPNSIEKPAYL